MIGIGVGIGRQRFASGIFAAYAARVAADGGVTEAGACVDAVSALLQTASLLLVPSGYKSGKVYCQKPTDGDGDLTFTRASTATRVNSDGEIESVATGVPRLDYSQGSCPSLLLEPQRTNSVGNSTLVGASTSPSTLPTGWGFYGFNSVITKSVVGLGVENGINYIDIRYQGTQISNGFEGINLNSSTSIIQNQLITFSAFIKIVAGTFPTTTSFYLRENNSVGGFLNEQARPYTANTTLSRYVGTFTIANANTASARCDFRFSLLGGTTYDFTIRIAAPQFEEGAFATSYIPTLGTSVTRIQEGQKVENIADLIGQTEGTIFIDVNFRVLTAGEFRTYFSLEGSVSGRFSGFNAITANNGNNVSYAGISYALTEGRHKIVCTYSQANNERKLYVDGVLRATSTHANFLATIDKLSVGCRINPFAGFNTDRPLVGGVNQFALFPILLSNDDCLTLSTL